MLKKIMFYQTIMLVFLFTVNAGLAQVKLAPNERISAKDGAVQVYIPSGEFIMGVDDPEMLYEDAERPSHPVKITKGFWMDKYEVTNEKFAIFLNKYMEKKKIVEYPKILMSAFGRVNLDHPLCGVKLNEKTRKFSAKSGWEKLPVMPVTWTGANEYCTTMGKRLPTEAQWEYAAGGPEHFKYPWGNKWRRTWANVAAGKPAKIGSYPKDVSPFGVMDMAGNVREWVYDKFDLKYYSESPRENPANYAGAFAYVKRVIRGGGFAFTEWDSRTTSRGNRRYTSHPVGTGFRCVESGPPPSEK